ncbi:MAG: aminopeptidase 1 [Alphaproteobacteria bacterium]|nr:MAG: aminopeptidase 1 [Alphaproteobacteria bacterium]
MTAGLAATLAASVAFMAAPGAWADDKPCAQGTCDSAWKDANSKKTADAMALGEAYKKFLSGARTELQAVAAVKQEAERMGFREWKPGTAIKAGARYYHLNRDRAMTLIIGGAKPVAEGVRIVASHIDSPRLELKGRPVYDTQEFALFQTNYHGGIKTYQWTNVPLALVGRVDRKDGKTVEINIGIKDSDPIFIIPDLSPHVARDQMKKDASSVVEHEDLDPIAASGPHGDLNAGDWVLKFLKDSHNLDASDMVSAELALVPAMAPRDVGFDRRLIAAYGQDDRLAAFASLHAAAEVRDLPETAVILLADNEESGNINNTGASSSYLTDLIGEMLFAEAGDQYRQPMLARALRASKALSIDVNPGVNPMNPGVWELSNAPRLGYGVNIKLYGRGFNANSEFIAWTRAALDEKKVPWQTTTYKVGRAGGGTLGGEIARYNVDTIDFGVPVLSIHTPYAVSDKLDVMALRDGIAAFLQYKR